MQYTAEQSAGFKTEFARRRKRQLLGTIPLFVAVIAVALASGNKSEEILGLPVAVWGTVVALIFIGSFAFAFQNWRCPACNKSYCPGCGVELS